MVTITPYGAAGEVTGSAYLVESASASVLVDFGMFQGDKDDDARNVIPGRIHRMDLSSVLLTHGHLDHSGRLPLLVREGYRGPIYATQATRDIAEIILSDAAHIQESDFERRKRKALKRGVKLNRNDAPLYEMEDVERTMEQFVDVFYDQPVQVAPGMTAVYHDAGHLLGSASIELRITDGDAEKVVVFSGDVGPPGLPYLQDADPPVKADVLFLESTYGDRNHKSIDETLREFEQIIIEAVEQKGKIFIPSFAIGRAQQILYYLSDLIVDRDIPAIPIFLDSPMAIKSVAAYRKNSELFDTEATDLIASGTLRKGLRTVRFCETADESRAINDEPGPFIVIAGSGMCTAGRIMHHIRNNINDPKSHFLIVGYQAHGSLGRRLVDGAKSITVMGDYKEVRAKIHTLGGFSAHAGQVDLVRWYADVARNGAPVTFLTHGEDEARHILRDRLNELHGVNAYLPVYSEHLEV
jgi:metallo-beta-lactamase family protein